MSKRLPEAVVGQADESSPAGGPTGAPDDTDTPAQPGEAVGDTAATRTGRGRHYRRRRGNSLVNWVLVLLVAAAVAFGLRLYVVQTFFVPSSSMVPTLQVGDRMLVPKIGYTIDRGSILVFRQPPADLSDPNHEDLVKRV